MLDIDHRTLHGWDVVPEVERLLGSSDRLALDSLTQAGLELQTLLSTSLVPELHTGFPARLTF